VQYALSRNPTVPLCLVHGIQDPSIFQAGGDECIFEDMMKQKSLLLGGSRGLCRCTWLLSELLLLEFCVLDRQSKHVTKSVPLMGTTTPTAASIRVNRVISIASYPIRFHLLRFGLCSYQALSRYATCLQDKGMGNLRSAGVT
jgi:hypothetical protein